MNIADLAIRKPVITWLFVILLIAGGFLAYDRLGRFEDPAFTIKQTVVYTPYPGASPEEVEEEVTDVIETAVQRMPNVKKITSRSEEGASMVTVEMDDSYRKQELRQVWDELRHKVADVENQLPPGAGPSVVNDDFGDEYGILFAVTGEGYSLAEIQDYADYLRRELLLVPGVKRINFWGEQYEAVFVEMSRTRLATLGLSSDLIFGTLAQHNLVDPAGTVRAGDEDLRIRVGGSFESVADIGELLIAGDAERMVRLKDVAEISRGYMNPPYTLLRFNGRPAIGMGISTIDDGNVVKTGEAVKQRLAELDGQRPYGMELGIVSWQSDAVTRSVRSFIVNLIEALLIVIALLMIFMGIRSGVLIGGILLLIVAGTFIVMEIMGVNLQRISLGALIIALGMLVDNAIVVTDGILVRLQRGMDRHRAAVETVSRTMWPLLGATVVAILAFAGIGFSPDNTGEYSRSLFQVILISLLWSWVLAVTVTPLLCVRWLKVPAGQADPYDKRFYHRFRRFLSGCLAHRSLTLGVMAALFVVSLVGFGHVKPALFAASERPQFAVDYWLPHGTAIGRTSDDVAGIEEYLLDLEGVCDVSSWIGAGPLRFMLVVAPEQHDSGYAQLLVSVDDSARIDTLMPQIYRHLAEHYPDSTPWVWKYRLGPGGGSAIQARFSGPDVVVLKDLAARTRAIMNADGGVVNIKDDWRNPELVLRPGFDEGRARLAGISRSQVAGALNYTVSGTTVGVYREDNKLLPVIARPPAAERRDVEGLADIQVWSQTARAPVPLEQVTSGFSTSWEDPIRRRHNRRPTITVMCDQVSGVSSTALDRIRPQVELLDLPEGYTLEWGGEYETSTDAQQGLGVAMPLGFLAMLVILIMLFNAWKEPLIIMLCLPLALIGVTAGLLLTGLPFEFMALLGLLSLSGMLIKNAVVLMDEINLQVHEGKPRLDAVLDGTVSRVRPVMMAAMTTVLGMTPLIGDPFFRSMSVTIMFGLTFATLLTLIVVPVLYAVFFRVRDGERQEPAPRLEDAA